MRKRNSKHIVVNPCFSSSCPVKCEPSENLLVEMSRTNFAKKNGTDSSSCWSNKVSSSSCLVFDPEVNNLSSVPSRIPIEVDTVDAVPNQSIFYKASSFYYISTTHSASTDINSTIAVFIATSTTSRCLAFARELCRGRVMVRRKEATAAVPNRANLENCERRAIRRWEEVEAVTHVKIIQDWNPEYHRAE